METPQISSTAYTATAFGLNTTAGMSLGGAQVFAPHRQILASLDDLKMPSPLRQLQGEIIMASTRRLVQVFIVDPDENVPLDEALLHKGEQQLTDATDQELYFEIDIKALLDAHNEMRAKLINKAVKERTEYLEAVRVRDLKMVVVELAQF